VYARLAPPAESDSANTRELRAQLFRVLGLYGKDPAILSQAREVSLKFLADRTSVDATLGQTALAITARNGDAALFDQLQQVYENSTNPEFQEGALRLLAEFENPALAQRSMDYAVSGKVRNQDAVIQFAIALGSSENREQAWAYIQNNWEKVQAQFTTEMGAVLVSSTGRFCSADGRSSVEKFFSTHKVAASDKALKHALESIDGCIELRALQEPNLKQWLAGQPAQ
jgi:aminopeptidase N/puromycin-sensitive aminopeptidase